MISRVSIACVLAAALLGTLSEAGLPAGAPAKAGEFFVLAGDFHVHGFPGDGALPAWALRTEARRRGLHVIALTNHNHRLAGRIGRWLGGDDAKPLVLQSEEVTAAHYHMTAIGIEERIPATLSASDAIKSIHAQGGVAIAAHPAELFWRGWDPAARAALDGAEIAHPMVMGDPQARAELIEFTRATRVLNPRLAPIGSTDFHYRQPMGLCRTFLFAREYSEAGVLEAIRAGRTVAFDPDGRAYGDPGLVAAATRVKASNDPPDRWRRLLDALSGCLALIGLAGWMIQD
jgi:predicted metal-dependent phosphoesterase TrpH